MIVVVTPIPFPACTTSKIGLLNSLYRLYHDINLKKHTLRSKQKKLPNVHLKQSESIYYVRKTVLFEITGSIPAMRTKFFFGKSDGFNQIIQTLKLQSR